MDQYKKKSVFLEKNKEILDAKLWIILKGLKIALKIMANTKNILVTILCDSQKALQGIKHLFSYKKNGFWEAWFIVQLKNFKKTEIQ